MMYGELYIPWIAQGTLIRAGRFISVPDIEAQLAPNNYVYSYSMTYAYDNFTNTGINAAIQLNKNWMVQVGIIGRIGVAADKFLLYGKGGYANSNVDVKALSGPPVAGITASANRASDGWVVGGGLEYRLRRSLVLGVEYNYVELGGSRLSSTTGGTLPGLPFNVDLGDVRFQTVTARLSILLDAGPTAPTK